MILENMKMESRSKKSVLIVDDNLNNLQLASTVLSPFYRLMLADSGEKALRTLEVKLPDIILLDIMMPGISGFEVCKQLKSNERTKDIPVIFLTAKVEESDIAMAFDVGGADYISKPFKSREVLARIKTHLDLQTAMQELQLKNQELIKLVQNRDKFFSIIAHDLRSPFSGVIGLLELVAMRSEKYTKEDLVRYIQMVYESVLGLYGLLDNLLKWSKIQRDIFEAKLEHLSLSAIIQENILVVNPKAIQKEIKISYTADDSLSVFSDKDVLSIVIRNLLSNAMKFSLRGGEVSVSARRCDTAETEVAVADNGVGMPAEVFVKLFDISEKISSVGTEEEPSSGLGLILCKEYIEKIGGKIWAESEFGKGSTFYFTIPDAE